ncbi:Ppx/GppA phosphatase family protein [Rubripirellula reticaptiva]|uniref:Exopolyphosphatase n=1 Tax=Rubripirellula reticaptiva TaxID=2528013 RepID=A0A5C6F758_9BACT|nr:Ppx/GppA phosphatase family protein [Rubripirellula reticaptiva]TWU57543.1 Exopolyphosphatase [Rubripirellula reticaptiva]
MSQSIASQNSEIASPATTDGSPRPVAVIDIGATSIRMAIAEIHPNGEVRTLDTLVQSVELGREAFDTRRLSRRSIEKSASVMRRYKRVLREYGITSPTDVRVVATSAVREAVNRLAFSDRIFVATGFNVESIDEAEVNRITYMGVMPHLRSNPELADGKSIVVEVGGGNTEMLIVRGGNVLHSQSYRLGSLRLLRTLEGVRASIARRRSMLESHIRRTVLQITDAVKNDTSIHLVALGGDMRFAGHQLLDDWDGNGLAKVPMGKLEKLTEKLLTLNEESIVKRYNANFIEAELVGPALLSYTLLAKHFELPYVYVCDTNLRDGLLHDMAVGGTWTADFRNQTVRSAISLGRKFDFDETHARNVAELSRKLFDQLQEEHGLDSRHEVLLFVAALLHEIGMMINVRSNHKHALYLIRYSDLFGLSRDELLLVGLVARYHRRANPQPSHEAYGTLPQHSRVVVSKLAAILRLAISLDDTRSGRVREIQCVIEAKRLVISVPGLDDVSLEQIAMRENSGLFRDIFGLPVMLRAGRLE